VIVVLIKCPKSLRVYYDYWQLLIDVSLAVKNFFPEPEPLGAGLDGGSDWKPANGTFVFDSLEEQLI